MTQTEKETIEIFCRVLSLELSRITGNKIEICLESLPGISKLLANRSIKRIYNKTRESYPVEAQI